MTENLKLNMSLMFRDSEVVELTVSLCENLLSIDDCDVVNVDLYPHALQEPNYNIKNWIISRLMPSNMYHYILMIPIIFHRGTNRRPYAQFALSLETNGVSLADHYWFNPYFDTEFEYEGRRIFFKHKTWEEIDQWQHDMWSDDLNKFLFNDILLSCSDNPLPNINNPIFTTNGSKEKKWYKENGVWILEKRLDNDSTSEAKCLDFFKGFEIVTPKYEIIHRNVTDKYQFYPETIQDGFNTIKKECLTSKRCELTPLSWYMNRACEDNIHSILNQVQKAVKIDHQVLKNFEMAIQLYMKTFNYKQIDTNNLGLLVDTDNNAIPVVWSNVGYVEDNPFINNLQF